MKYKPCPVCGLNNWHEAEECERCGATLRETITPVMVTPAPTRQRAITPTHILLLLIGVAVASVAYYFVFALPKYNEAKIALEKQKLEEEQKDRDRRIEAEQRSREEDAKEKERKEFNETLQRSLLSACLEDAEENRMRYVKKNGGTPESDGWISAPRTVWADADRKMELDKSDCYRKYK